MSDEPVKPWHLPAGVCADYLGITKSSFSRRGYDAVAKSGRQVFYDITEICRFEMSRGKYEAEDGEEIDHPAEQARWTKARRIAQELENEREQGRLRPVAEVDAAVTDALSPVAAALDSLPMAIKRACPELSQTAIEMVEREIATMRNALADDHITDSGESSAGEDAASPVSANGGGVG